MIKRILILLSIGIIISLLSNKFVFNSHHLSPDENSYVFQAQLLSSGRFHLKAHPLKEFFSNSMIVHKDRWYSRYPPGHCLLQIPGVLLKNVHLIPSIFSGITLVMFFLLAKEIGVKNNWIYIAMLWMVCTPYYFLTYGSNLSETTNVTLLLAFALFFVKAFKKKNVNYIDIFLAAIFLGISFNTRPYTCLCFSVPFAVFCIIDLAKNKNIKPIAIFIGVFSIFILFYLYYNYKCTGKLFLQTYDAYEPNNGLGFGKRAQGFINFNLAMGLKNTWNNVLLLGKVVFGFKLSGILFLLFALITFKYTWLRYYFISICTVIVGYLFFWFWGQDFSGPIYYFEILPFIILISIIGIKTIYEKISDSQYILYFKIIGIIILIFHVVCLSKTYALLIDNIKPTVKELNDLNETIYKRDMQNRLVFLDPQGLISDFVIARNTPFLDDDVLVVPDLGFSNYALVQFYNERVPYKLIRKSNQYSLEPIKPGGAFYFNLGSFSEFKLDTGFFIGQGDKIVRKFDKKIHKEGWIVKSGPKLTIASGKYQIKIKLNVTDLKQKDNICRLVIKSDLDGFKYIEQNIRFKHLNGLGDWKIHKELLSVKKYDKIVISIYAYESFSFLLDSIRIKKIDKKIKGR